MVFPGFSIVNVRRPSLARGVVLSIGAFVTSLGLAGFPHLEQIHGSHWQVLPLLAAVWGMTETARCLRRKWSLYHAGVMILLYSDLLILAAIVCLLVLT